VTILEDDLQLREDCTFREHFSDVYLLEDDLQLREDCTIASGVKRGRMS